MEFEDGLKRILHPDKKAAINSDVDSENEKPLDVKIKIDFFAKTSISF